jgi:hypothetical protein
VISLIEELTALDVQLYRWTSKLFAALVVEQGLTTVRVERFRRTTPDTFVSRWDQDGAPTG